jgi:hypothetical protein
MGQWQSGWKSRWHFILNLSLPNSAEISSILIYSSDENGNPSGGQYWHTADESYWLLSAFDTGVQLNKNHVSFLGAFSGQVQSDLYCADSGWFEPGNRFAAEVVLGSLRKLASIPSA